MDGNEERPSCQFRAYRETGRRLFILGLVLAATLLAVVAIPFSVIRYFLTHPENAPVDIGIACGAGLVSIAVVFRSVGPILDGVARVVAARNATLPTGGWAAERTGRMARLGRSKNPVPSGGRRARVPSRAGAGRPGR